MKTFESKGLKISLKKTKVMAKGLQGEIFRVDPCARCGKRVMAKSVLCVKCGE